MGLLPGPQISRVISRVLTQLLKQAAPSRSTGSARLQLDAFSSNVASIERPKCSLCSSYIVKLDELVMAFVRRLPNLFDLPITSKNEAKIVVGD
jgi:hypothetical protein